MVVLIVKRSLVDVRQQHCPASGVQSVGGTATPSCHCPVRSSRKGKDPVGVVIVVQCKARLLEIVFALAAAGCFPRLLHGRQQKSDQDGDDRDDDQVFDQRKSTGASLRSRNKDRRTGHERASSESERKYRRTDFPLLKQERAECRLI